jgi:hypothetical protein
MTRIRILLKEKTVEKTEKLKDRRCVNVLPGEVWRTPQGMAIDVSGATVERCKKLGETLLRCGLIHRDSHMTSRRVDPEATRFIEVTHFYRQTRSSGKN